MQGQGEIFDRREVFRIAADKIEHQPELLDRSLVTLERWLANGITPRHRLQAWVDRIKRARLEPDAMHELLARLREDGEDAEFDRDFSPFGCLLTKAERRVLIKQCAYSH